jgi:hypothetical protein
VTFRQVKQTGVIDSAMVTSRWAMSRPKSNRKFADHRQGAISDEKMRLATDKMIGHEDNLNGKLLNVAEKKFG